MSGAGGASRESLSARAERVRDRALEPLAERLGYACDRRRPARWRRPGSLLSIDGAKFYDYRRGRGGGGAIDLVMHARGCGFRAAVDFLDALALPAVALPPAPGGRRPPPRLPAPAPRNWAQVRGFLVRVRGLHPDLVDTCFRSGRLYADARRNAVFPCRDRHGRIAGAELVGTGTLPEGSAFKAMAPGSRKDWGGFWIATGPAPLAACLLVESALDALAASLLPAPGLPARTLIASTAGVARRLPAWLADFSGPQLLCGYDADAAGDRAARDLCARCPGMRRLRPVGAKDWNDLVRRQPPLLPPLRLR